jgi:hypothetical protein
MLAVSATAAECSGSSHCDAVASYYERSNLANSFHPDDGGDTSLQNLGSYKSHTVSYPKLHSS